LPDFAQASEVPGAELQLVGEPTDAEVIGEVRTLPARPELRSPAVQAAAVAAGSFAAGVATVAVWRRRRSRRAVKARRRRGERDLLSVVGSRSFLVDIHLLGGRD
jgi:hypothetical protein